jgi:PAS domain S-box-containing protein
MLGDNDKTESQLLDEVQELRRRVGELERSNAEHEQAEAALTTSEARFRAIHEYAPLMIDAFDEDGRCILWNRECERIFGWTMAELNAHDDPLSLFYPDPQVRSEVMKTVTAAPGGTFREWHPLTKEGAQLTTLWANFQLPDGTVINLGQDISERKRTEEELTAYREQLEQLVDERTAELRELNANFKQEITERKKAEEALRLKDYIIESASNVIATSDLDGRMTYVNPTFLETWGFDDPGEILGRPFSEFWMVEERLEEIMDALQCQGTWSDEIQARKRNGKLFDVQVSAAMVHDNEGRPVSLMSSSVDITERKRTQEALRESEQTVRALVETSQDWIWAIDLNGKHTYCNPAIEPILGYRPDELVGRRSLKFMHSDDRRKVEEKLPRWIAEKQGWSNLLVRWRHKDGSWWFLESNAVPILDAAGELIGFRGVDRDISDRRRAEEELRDSEAKLRAIVDHSPALISTKDLDGNITLANRHFEVLSGPAPQEFIGRNVYDLFPHDVADELWKNDLAARGGPVETEETVEHSDGTKHVYLTVKFPLTNEDGTLLGTCAISTDITERKRNEEERLKLERQVQHAQKLESLGVLAGGIAHDFNNLLYVILGSAELALDNLSEVSPARPLIEEAETAARRAADLTRQMLAYSGRGQFEVRELNLSELAGEMAQLIKSSISKNVEMAMNLRARLPGVSADAAQLQQVIMNLITNAAEAVGEEENGSVKISTGTMHCSQQYLSLSRSPSRPDEGEFTYIEVVDSGCGMNEEAKEKLFDPFFTTKFTGRGLGMSAVLGIVRGHDGAIMVDSEPGEGTSIRVLLPALEESAKSTLGKRVDRESAKWSGKGTVLLADDEEGVRHLAKRMLEQLGFDVRIACDGREAIETFLEHSDEIVAVLLDLSMPHMDGQQACLKLQRENPDIPVVLASGYAEQEVEGRFAGRGGVVAFIQKPYRLQTLREKLRAVLEP